MYIHGAVLLVPNYYLITGVIKGQSLEQIGTQLRAQWSSAAFGMCFFWSPLCATNFLFVPQHSQILFVSVFSFLHKTWMSWLSNRQRHRERLELSNSIEATTVAAPPLVATSPAAWVEELPGSRIGVAVPLSA